MAVKKETEVITIPAIDIRTATITIKGDSPLIVHKWSEKAKKMMLDKQICRYSKRSMRAWKNCLMYSEPWTR